MSSIPCISVFPCGKLKPKPYLERANLLVREMIKENFTVGEMAYIFQAAINALTHVRPNCSLENQTLDSNSL